MQTCVMNTPLLAVRDADPFAALLLDTGCWRFISRPYTSSGASPSRRPGRSCFAPWWSVGPPGPRVPPALPRALRERLRHLLPNLGEGRDGFRPGRPSECFGTVKSTELSGQP